VSAPASQGRAALLAGVGCYTFWGLVPLLFQLMRDLGASPMEIVGHRAFWSVFWAGGLVLAAGQAPQVRTVFRSPGVLAQLLLSTVLITVNWSLYVWSVVNGHTLETSLGYYITPLINMAAGALIFRERLTPIGLAAMALAVVGVALQALAVGHVPWIAIVLALSFGGYGIVRKRVKADAQAGLFVECLLMTLPGLGLLAWLQAHGQGHIFSSPEAAAVLFIAGPATVVPLALFAWAARRMPLSSLGFLQFLGPTITFAIGVKEGEPLDALRAVSFAFIWAGAAVFAYGAWRAGRQAAGRPPAAPEISAARAAE
jgi:chloramphenicol-sensitive protein RarD